MNQSLRSVRSARSVAYVVVLKSHRDSIDESFRVRRRASVVESRCVAFGLDGFKQRQLRFKTCETFQKREYFIPPVDVTWMWMRATDDKLRDALN